MRDLSAEVAELFDDAAGRGSGEFFAGDTYSFRRLPKMDDPAFARLCKRLSNKRWLEAHPGKAAEYDRRFKAKPGIKRRYLDQEIARRAAAFAARKPLRCAWCRELFQRKRTGRIPSCCSPACAARLRAGKVAAQKRQRRAEAAAKRAAELLRCEECHRQFPRKPLGPPARFCSSPCQQRHARAVRLTKLAA